MEITKEIRDNAIGMSAELMENHADDIQKAFNENQEMLDIAFKIRFTSAKGKFKIKSEINFVTERIKELKEKWWDPDQRQLFNEEPGNSENNVRGQGAANPKA